MKFTCTVRQQNGRWIGQHHSTELGQFTVSADSEEKIIEKLRGELRYRLELCPCTGDSYQHLDVQIDVQKGSS